MAHLKILLSTYNEESGNLSKKTGEQLNAVINHRMGKEHVITVTKDSKKGLSSEKVTFIITAVKIDDGGDGFFGALAHHLLYGAFKYFKTGTELKSATQILREEAAKYFASGDSELAFSKELIREDMIAELNIKNKLKGKSQDDQIYLIEERIASFGETLRKPRYFSGDLLIAISKALDFKFSFDSDLILLEGSFYDQKQKHIAFLAKKLDDKSRFEYYSVISVVQKL